MVLRRKRQKKARKEKALERMQILPGILRMLRMNKI
jgi:hypothetical protein